MNRFKEVNIAATFDEMDPQDKIVDLAIGYSKKKNMLCIVTQRGESYLISYDLVSHIGMQSKQMRQTDKANKNKCHRLNLTLDARGNSQVLKAKKVFMSLDLASLWITAEDNTG